MRFLAAATVALSATQAPPTPPPPSFPSGVDAVYLDVAVRRDGQPVPGLTVADFELTDQGAPRPFEVVEGANAPVHAILALDISSSVQGPRLDALRAAAQAFLDGLAGQDRATLVTFSHRVKLETKVGVAPAEAKAALARAQAGGGTSLYDGVFAAVALADRRHGRPIVLVFSDGGDELSWLSEERLRGLVREGTGVVHAVAVTALPSNARLSVNVELDERGRAARERETGPRGGGMATSDSQRVFDTQARASTQRAPGAQVPPVLTALANETGGEVWRADEDAALGPAFASALADVRSRYVLRFEPAGGQPGEWRELKVRVKNGRGEVRGRKGYRVR
jgi:VWFA-related protein